MRECQKLWGGLCILQFHFRGGYAPWKRTVQNTQAPPEFLTLPQVIPTSMPIPISKKNAFFIFRWSLYRKVTLRSWWARCHFILYHLILVGKWATPRPLHERQDGLQRPVATLDKRPGAGQWRSRRPSQDGTPSQDELQGSYRAPNKSIWSKKCRGSCW